MKITKLPFAELHGARIEEYQHSDWAKPKLEEAQFCETPDSFYALAVDSCNKNLFPIEPDQPSFDTRRLFESLVEAYKTTYGVTAFLPRFKMYPQKIVVKCSNVHGLKG